MAEQTIQEQIETTRETLQTQTGQLQAAVPQSAVTFASLKRSQVQAPNAAQRLQQQVRTKII